MLRPFYTFLLVIFCFLCITPPSLTAQEEIPISVIAPFCENECVSAYAEWQFPEDVLYSWVFSSGFIQPPLTDTIYHIVTEYPSVDWCELPPGTYILFLEVTDIDGNVLGVGQTVFDVFFDSSYFVEASGSHVTACEQDTFHVYSPNGGLDCYDVCVGSTSTLTINELWGGINGQTLLLDPSQGTWTTNGQVVTDVNHGEGLSLSLSEEYAQPGTTTCLPLTVNDFENVAGLLFDLNYNASVLSFSEVINIHPSFSEPFIQNPFPGTINFEWMNPASGGSLEDNTVLLEVCFDVMGSTSSAVTFSGAEVFSTDGSILSPLLQSGAVIIGNTNVTPNSISILWEQEGTGYATFSGWIVTDFGCETYYEFNFCFNVLPPPSSDITTQPPLNPNGILEVCEGQTIFFSNESEDAETFVWDFGDGSGASVQNPTHAYTAAGNYEVELITSTNCECVDTSRITVIVEGNDAPFIDCVATICEGTSVTYTANTGCSTYTWDISPNGTVLDGGGASDDFITIQWGAGPIGEITLETDGCPDLSTCTTAAYIQIPIVSASSTIDGPDRVCQGEHAVYSLPPFEGVEFNWSVSTFGTIISGQGTQSVTIEWFDGPIPAAAQQVSVDYTNCYLECGGSASMDVFIRPEYYVSGDIEVCENTSSDYSVTSTQTNTGFPANFNVLDQTGTVVWTSTAAAPVVTIDWNFGAGDYTIVVQPQNFGDFCSQNYTFPVSVTAQPAMPTAIIGQNEICSGIAYTYHVEDPIDGERYHWIITNGANVSERDGNSITVNWDAAGPYSLSLSRLTPPLFCASAPINLTINPVTGFSITGDAEVCLDQIAAYTSTQTGDVYYDWSIMPANAGTITGDPTEGSIEVLWHNSGIATVLLEICGQQETFDVDVHAVPQPTVNAPAALCAGTTDIVSTVQAYSSYSWQDAEGVELSTNATPNLGGGYYRLEVTDDIGCVGSTTFYIYPYPESQISISTPDYNIFCNLPPSTRMYAVNTEDGYSFQWYENGSPIAGETGTSYTASAFGAYHVEIIDENGCSFASNTISVYEDCGDPGGTGGGASCNNSDHNFTRMEDGSCDNRMYTANAVGSIPGTTYWRFDDSASGVNNTATGDNVSHQFTKPGFYRVFMGALYDDGAGGQVLCRSIQPDTIYAVAAFDYEGVCPGLPVQFYDLSTFIADLTSLTDWAWDFGDPSSGAGNTSTDKDPVHTFTGEGIYSVTLTVTTTTGCTATITQDVLIYPLPFTNFEDPSATCAVTALAFVADVEATVSSVVWDFGEPATGNANTSTLFNSFHSYASAGTYVVGLEATSVYGCVNSFTKNIDITPNGLSGEIDPAGLSMLCEGENMVLTAPTSIATEWEWSNGEQTQSITIDEAASYEVTLTSAEGCTYTPELAAVDIISAPQSPIRAVTYNDFNQAEGYTYDAIYVCEGEEVFLETVQQAGQTYSWSSGDTDNTTEFSDMRGNILPEGEHTINLTVTDVATGCSAVEAFIIYVNPTPNQPLVTDGGGTLCAGTMTTLSVSNADASLSYIWSNGDSGSSITSDQAGEYVVTAFNTFGCSNESEVVEINEGPDISLVPNGCHTRCAPDTLCIPQIPNIVSYQWYQDGAIIPAPEGSVVDLIIMESGVYTLEMQDVNGCVQTSEPLNIDILPGYGTILGTVYYDTNDDATIDAGDDVAEGIAIGLANMTEDIGSITTDELGNYGYVNIPEDDYTLTLDSLSVPAGWKPQINSVDTTFVGCDQEVMVNWLLVPDCFDTTFVAAVCPDEDFVFQGQAYSVGSNETVLSPTGTGCDSTFNFSVQALISSTEMLQAEICPGEVYSFDGLDYPAGTNIPIQYVNSVGCDSIVQLVVTETEEATVELALEESCPNLASGRLSLTPLTGSTPFVYALDGGAMQNTSIFENLEAGGYDLEFEDSNGCLYSESFFVDAMENLIVDLQDVILPCDQASIVVQPEIYSGDDGLLQFVWSDGVTTQDRPVEAIGVLGLEVSNGCEQQTLAIEVSPEIAAQEQTLYVPNVFSPNEDGTNDVFMVYPSVDAQVEDLDFQVFDRWGSIVFDAEHASDGWEGISNGKKAINGVYIWRVKAKINLCGQEIDLKQEGEVLLVR